MNAEKANYPIDLLCKVMRVSRSGYYKWLLAPRPRRAIENEKLKEAMVKIHTASRGTYGRRRVFSTLRHQLFSCSRNRVARLMKELRIQGVGKVKFKTTTQSDHSLEICPNLIVQDFKINAPNVLWTSDITYIPTNEGWLYLSVVLDTFSRAIVGWSMQESLRTHLVTESIEMALRSRNPKAGTIFHSDRGSQYASTAVKNLLSQNNFHQSMSSTGNCYDNAITETFFATLKKELIHRCNFKTRKEAKTSIFEYIEVFYNKIRRHSAIGFLSPLEYERNIKL